MPADLAVIGLGPLGLPLAQAAVSAGIHTVGYRTGNESGSLSPAELRRMLSEGFRPATNPAELGRVRTAVICAPTPRGADGGLDLSQVESAARALAGHMRPHTTVILESPAHPGTTEEFLLPLLENGSGLRAGRDFHLAYSPSRVDPGNREITPANTPKVIGGLTPACTESAAAFYGRLTDKVVRARGLRRRRRSSSWRPTTGTSTSPWSTRWPCSATTWASTCGTSCAARRPSRTASRPSAPAPASAATASRRTWPATRAAGCAWWNSPSRSTAACRATSSSAPPPC